MGNFFPLAPCRRLALCLPVRLRGFAPYAPYGRSSRKPHSGSRHTAAGGSYSLIKRKLLHSAIAPLRNFFKSSTTLFFYRFSNMGHFSLFAAAAPREKESSQNCSIPLSLHYAIFSNHQRRPFCAAINPKPPTQPRPASCRSGQKKLG